MPNCSPVASAAGTTPQPGCHPPGHESSVSSACARTPLASAASSGPQTMVSPTTVATFSPPYDARERGRRPAGRQLGARYHRRDRVENVPLRLLEHGGRQGPVAGLTHVRRELPCDLADRVAVRGLRRHSRLGERRRRRARPGRHGGSCDRESGPLQDVAAREFRRHRSSLRASGYHDKRCATLAMPTITIGSDSSSTRRRSERSSTKPGG